MVREKSGNLRKKEESRVVLTGCLNVKVSPLLNFNSDRSFCQNTVSRGDGKFSEVGQNSIPSLTILPPGRPPGICIFLLPRGSGFHLSVIAWEGGVLNQRNVRQFLKKIKFSLCFKETNSSQQSRRSCNFCKTRTVTL